MSPLTVLRVHSTSWVFSMPSSAAVERVARETRRVEKIEKRIFETGGVFGEWEFVLRG